MGGSVQIGDGVATEDAMVVVSTWFFDDFFEFFAIRYPTIHHHDDELADIGGDSDDDLSHNAYNNPGVYGDVLGIAYLPIGPSPTPHFSGSCARHRSKLLMLTT